MLLRVQASENKLFKAFFQTLLNFLTEERREVVVANVRLFIVYIYTPHKQSLGGYIGITLSVRPSMYLVSATPPKRLIGFL